MDKYLGVNVYDSRDLAIAGVDVTFKVKFNGKRETLGPIQTQGIKDKPVSIQLPDQIDDPTIEVTASYGDHHKTVLVDTRQTTNTIIKFDFPIPEGGGDEGGGGTPNPLQVLNMARHAVPAVNYALGLAGIAAAGAIITLFLGNSKATIVIIALIFIGMILLFAFSQLLVSRNRSIQLAGAVLLWAVLLFFVIFLIFTVTAFSGEWPRPWANFIGIISNAEVQKTSQETRDVQKAPPETRDFDVSGPVARFGCEENATATAAYDAPPGWRIILATPHVGADTGDVKNQNARISKQDEHHIEVEATFRGRNRDLGVNCPSGGHGQAQVTGKIQRD